MLRKHLQIIILVLLIVGSSLAGDKIKLKLHQPPPNKMPVSSLWAMDIENTTKEDVTIYLFGTVNGDRQGEIVGGTSKPFNLKPGKSTYQYDDFKSGEVKWVNKSIQEIIIRTGEVPEDNYTICVTAYYEDGNVAEQQQCIMQLIVRGSEGIITLVSPSDGEEFLTGGGVDEEQMKYLNFVWTATGLKGPYTLIIKELKNGQTNEQAMAENRVFFEKKDIKTSTYQYGLNDPKLDAGKKYVWGIVTKDVQSEIYSCSLIAGKGLDPDCVAKTINGQLVGVLSFPPYNNCAGTTLQLNDGTIPICIWNNAPNYVENDILTGNWSDYFLLNHCSPTAPAPYPVNFGPAGCKNPPAPNDLVAWFPFDEWKDNYLFSEQIVNYQVQSSCLVNNNVNPVWGKVYYGINFNGSNSYLKEEPGLDIENINFGQNSDFSIVLWIKFSSIITGINPIIDKRELKNGKYVGYHLGYSSSSNKFVLQLADGTGTFGFSNYESDVFSSSNLTSNFCLIAVTVRRSGSNLLKNSIQFYINGSLNGKKNCKDRFGDLSNSGPLLVGTRFESPVYFNGIMDELQIYKKALSQSEINLIYSSAPFGLCKDLNYVPCP